SSRVITMFIACSKSNVAKEVVIPGDRARISSTLTRSVSEDPRLRFGLVWRYHVDLATLLLPQAIAAMRSGARAPRSAARRGSTKYGLSEAAHTRESVARGRFSIR